MFDGASKSANRSLSPGQRNSVNKSRLNQYCQKADGSFARYTTEKKGDLFVARVTVNGISYMSLEAHVTKKDAESDAAYVALQTLVQRHATAETIEDLLESVEKKKPAHSSFMPSKLGYRQLPASNPSVSISPARVIQSGPPQSPTASKTYLSEYPLLPAGKPPVSISPTHMIQSGPSQLHASTPVCSSIPPSSVPTPLQTKIDSVSQIQPQSIPLPQKSPVTPPGSPPGRVPVTSGGYGLPPVSPVLSTVPRGEAPVSAVSTSPSGRPTAMGSDYLQKNISQTAVPVQQTVVQQTAVQQMEVQQTAVQQTAVQPMEVQQTAVQQTAVQQTAVQQMAVQQTAVQQTAIQQTAVQYNFEAELERYCSWRQILPPVYTIMVEWAVFIGKVVVDGVEYGSNRGQSTFHLAREDAAIIAIASLGLQVLQMQYKVPQSGGKPYPGIASRGSSVGITETHLSGSLASLSLQQFPPVVSAVVTSHPQQVPAPTYSNSSGNSPRTSYTPGVLSPQQTASTGNSQVAPACKMSLNYKVALNEYCQKRGIPVPRYDCTYPEDAVGYIVTLHVGEKVFRSKTEGTKRAAESTAASMALQSLGESLGGREEVTSNGHSAEPTVLLKPSSIPANERIISYKNLLQEYLQKSHVSELPVYRTEREDGGFVCTVSLKLATETRRFTGQPHPNKKAAEQTSARAACLQLNLIT